MQKALTTLLLIASLGLGGCSPGAFGWVYSVEVPQGNVFDEEDLDRLQAGMTREQVQQLLGTPMIRDPFHANRWDYPYRLASEPGPDPTRHLILLFEDDRLARIDQEPVTPAE